MKRIATALFLLLAVSGCVGKSINNAIGASYVSIEAAAVSVQRECMNTVPNGPCHYTSLITTEEKDKIKVELQHAKDYTDDAALITAGGEGKSCTEAQQCLVLVNRILGSIEQLLMEREKQNADQ